MKRSTASPPPKPTLWRNVRIAILLRVLAIAAYSTWYDRFSTTRWTSTLWVGIFPIDADGNPGTEQWLARLSPGDVAAIETFLNSEAHRHGVSV